MCFIPWVFNWQGQRLRDGSRFCTFLKEKKVAELAELERQRTTREQAVRNGAVEKV
jgi:hypothetical protein